MVVAENFAGGVGEAMGLGFTRGYLHLAKKTCENHAARCMTCRYKKKVGQNLDKCLKMPLHLWQVLNICVFLFSVDLSNWQSPFTRSAKPRWLHMRNYIGLREKTFVKIKKQQIKSHQNELDCNSWVGTKYNRLCSACNFIE